MVNDVTADPRYLTAFAATLSEAIIPVLDSGTRIRSFNLHIRILRCRTAAWLEGGGISGRCGAPCG